MTSQTPTTSSPLALADSLCVDEAEVNMLLKLRCEEWSLTLQMFNEPALAEKAAQKTDKERSQLKKGGFCTDHEVAVAELKRLADLTKLYKQ